MNMIKCKYDECPFLDIEKPKEVKPLTRVQKLTEAMELIKQAYSLDTKDVVFVMASLYDFVQKEFPEKALLVDKE